MVIPLIINQIKNIYFSRSNEFFSNITLFGKVWDPYYGVLHMGINTFPKSLEEWIMRTFMSRYSFSSQKFSIMWTVPCRARRVRRSKSGQLCLAITDRVQTPDSLLSKSWDRIRTDSSQILKFLTRVRLRSCSVFSRKVHVICSHDVRF